RPYPDLTCLCYHFDADLVLSLGRTADRACRRGDLVSQRGKEPKTHYRSSFEDNEGENSRCPRFPSRAGEETRSTHTRPKRSSGAASGDDRGVTHHLEL